MSFGPLQTILGGLKFKNISWQKWSFFFGIYHDPNDPISTHINEKTDAKFNISAFNYLPLVAQKPEK